MPPGGSRGSDRKAVVVGAGLGGLAAALELRRAGYEVSVFERAARLSEVDTGLTLWAFAVRRLRDHGLADKLPEIGTPLERIAHRTPSGRHLSDVSVTSHAREMGVPSYEVHRSKLQGALADALGLDAIHFDKRCVRAGQADGRAEAAFADGTMASGAILIGADGVHSVVRRSLFEHDDLRGSPFGVWRGTTEMAADELPPGLHVRFMGRGRLFGLARISPDTVRWYAAAPAPDAPPASGAESKEFALREFDGWCHQVRDVLDRTSEAAYLFNDTPNAPPRATWGDGWITLLGDAAHSSLPTLGISAGVAIEDAAVLRKCLRENGDSVHALRSYERKRRPATARIVRAASAFGKVIAIRRQPAYALRQAGVAIAPQASVLRWLSRGGHVRYR